MAQQQQDQEEDDEEESEDSDSDDTDEDPESSIVQDVGSNANSCGYCKSGSNSSIAHGGNPGAAGRQWRLAD